MSDEFQHLSVQRDENVLILTLEVTRVTEYELAKSLEQELLRTATDQDTPKVAVDMSKLEFMSSVAYMPFIGLRSCIHDRGGRLILCEMSDVIREVFDATRLLINPSSPKSLFEYTQSREEAIRLLR